MRYTKLPTDITIQLAMLQQRGLIVSDEDTALKQLASISFFRLANYWKVFETDDSTHRFASGACLEDVFSLYTFDRELRAIIFAAIQDVEVALRTRIIHFFSMAHEELKSRFVLSRVAFSHVEINSGIVIISCAIDMESADPKVAVC